MSKAILENTIYLSIFHIIVPLSVHAITFLNRQLRVHRDTSVSHRSYARESYNELILPDAYYIADTAK